MVCAGIETEIGNCSFFRSMSLFFQLMPYPSASSGMVVSYASALPICQFIPLALSYQPFSFFLLLLQRCSTFTVSLSCMRREAWYVCSLLKQSLLHVSFVQGHQLPFFFFFSIQLIPLVTHLIHTHKHGWSFVFHLFSGFSFFYFFLTSLLCLPKASEDESGTKLGDAVVVEVVMAIVMVVQSIKNSGLWWPNPKSLETDLWGQ